MKRENLRELLVSWCFCCAALDGLGAGDETGAKASSSPRPSPQEERERSVTNGMTVEGLVAEGLERNPELSFYRAELAAAKAGRKAAGLWANPELSGSAGHKSSRALSSGLGAEGVAWSVSVVQPVEWPGRIGLRKAIANREIELAELGLERFRAALAGRVRGLGNGLFAAQEKAAAAREAAERFRALREVLVQREPAGVTPLLETRVIEATELTMQRKASEAELATQAALLELNQLRGAPPGERLSVAPPRLTFRAAEQADALLAAARTNNFELRVRASELAQQGFKVALAKNERFPAISVGPSFSEETAFERERVVGVGVSLPLPLWNRNSANIETAQARRLQAETSLLVAQREVERKVLEAALTYESKLREMGKWRADAVEHFREAAELADRHYRLGAVPIATHVELQRQYLDALESLLDTRKEALQAAQNLELLTGLRPPLVSVGAPEDQK
jgi:cobalt-zinc-cadmium efflux system outer membrane protein